LKPGSNWRNKVDFLQKWFHKIKILWVHEKYLIVIIP
jgi:hypothetical protein